MECKTEGVQILDKKAALRRLYYSHPLVVVKEKHSKPPGAYGKLINTFPLLSRRSTSSMTGSLSEKSCCTTEKKSQNSFSLKINDDDLIGDSKILNFNVGDRAFSASVGKSRRKGLRQKGKPSLITAMKINSYGIGGNAKSLICNNSDKLIISVDDAQKVKQDVKGPLQMSGPTSLMFKQWGIRKCLRSTKSPIRYNNNWVNGHEAWSQSVNVFNYKSAGEKLLQKENIACRIKVTKLTPLPPNTSPSSTEALPFTDLRNANVEDSAEMAQQEYQKNEPHIDFDVTLTPPNDERKKEFDNKTAISEVDTGCLFPTIDNFFSRNFDPHPSKSYYYATEGIQPISKVYRVSACSSVLDNIIEAIEEED